MRALQLVNDSVSAGPNTGALTSRSVSQPCLSHLARRCLQCTLV